MGKKTGLRLREVAVMGAVCALLCGTALADDTLIPVGQTVGIQLDVEGVLVAGMSEVETARGAVSPGRDGGLRMGDVILEVAGEEVHSSQDLTDRISAQGAVETELTVKRDGRTQRIWVCPAETVDGDVRLGLWLRDGIAGVGTVTYIDPETGAFGALGHGVNDLETGALLPMEKGTVCPAQVVDVRSGKAGEPGELAGCFDADCVIGEIRGNTSCGIFGVMDGGTWMGGRPIPVAGDEQVRSGPATILSCVSGQAVQAYEVEITPVGIGAGDGRDLMVHVTDPELLAITGGIVQGMSGSPIIQNGKLVGAVTHVLVNDPTRGYGILIENMLEVAE